MACDGSPAAVAFPFCDVAVVTDFNDVEPVSDVARRDEVEARGDDLVLRQRRAPRGRNPDGDGEQCDSCEWAEQPNHAWCGSPIRAAAATTSRNDAIRTTPSAPWGRCSRNRRMPAKIGSAFAISVLTPALARALPR